MDVVRAEALGGGRSQTSTEGGDVTTGAMFISWGNTVRGREAKSLEVFGKALELAEKEHKAGRIHGHKEYFALDGVSDGIAGFQIIEGELEALSSMRLEDEWRDLMIAANSIVEDFRVRLVEGGSDQAIQEGMGRYMNQLGELGYM